MRSVAFGRGEWADEIAARRTIAINGAWHQPLSRPGKRGTATCRLPRKGSKERSSPRHATRRRTRPMSIADEQHRLPASRRTRGQRPRVLDAIATRRDLFMPEEIRSLA
jgi:hypothetical protein